MGVRPEIRWKPPKGRIHPRNTRFAKFCIWAFKWNRPFRRCLLSNNSITGRLSGKGSLCYHWGTVQLPAWSAGPWLSSQLLVNSAFQTQLTTLGVHQAQALLLCHHDIYKASPYFLWSPFHRVFHCRDFFSPKIMCRGRSCTAVSVTSCKYRYRGNMHTHKSIFKQFWV